MVKEVANLRHKVVYARGCSQSHNAERPTYGNLTAIRTEVERRRAADLEQASAMERDQNEGEDDRDEDEEMGNREKSAQVDHCPPLQAPQNAGPIALIEESV